MQIPPHKLHRLWMIACSNMSTETVTVVGSLPVWLSPIMPSDPHPLSLASSQQVWHRERPSYGIVTSSVAPQSSQFCHVIFGIPLGTDVLERLASAICHLIFAAGARYTCHYLKSRATPGTGSFASMRNGSYDVACQAKRAIRALVILFGKVIAASHAVTYYLCRQVWHQAATSSGLVFSLCMAAFSKRSVMNFFSVSSVSSFVILDVGSGMTMPNSA